MVMSDIRIFPQPQTIPATRPKSGRPQAESSLLSDTASRDEIVLKRKANDLQFGAKKISRSSIGLSSPWSALATSVWDNMRRRDPDLDEFMDILDGQTTEEYLMDQIINEKFQMGEDGSITIDKPKIKIPTFRHGNEDGKGGGGGDEGDGDGDGDGDPTGKGGKGDTQKKLMPWQTKYGPSEVARIIGNQFNLPFLRPSDGESNRFKTIKDNIKYVPPGDLNRKKTFRNAIRREVGQAVAKGQEPNFNNIVPHRPDKRYKAIELEPLPELKVAVIYVADVSGSITKDMRDFTKTANKFVSYPLKYKYGVLSAELAGDEYNDADYFGKDGTEEGGLKERFIVYTNEARETSEEDFYKVDDTGGTQCSSGFDKAREIIEKDYPPADGWNVYIYHYTDGDIFGSDEKESVKSIKNLLNMGVRYIGNCDLGQAENSPSKFRKLLLNDKELKGSQHIGSLGMPTRGKPKLDDYKKVVSTFLPARNEETEWYETSA